MQNQVYTPFVYHKTERSEKAADVLLSIIRPLLKANTSCLREKVQILIQSLSRPARHALFHRYNVPVLARGDDRDQTDINNLINSIENQI